MSGLIKRFKEKLGKTQRGILNGLDRIFSGNRKIDERTLEELEELLITSDIGVGTTQRFIHDLQERVKQERVESGEQLKEFLKEEMKKLFGEQARSFLPWGQTNPPAVVLVVGVNGVGKTTTIGKLAFRFSKEGKKVLLAAGDTFRAAAIEQLELWGQKVGAEVVKQQSGADPSAVIFDALVAAKARGADVVIADTAGRLHTKTHLMEELKKIKRVMGKEIPESPHEVLLVLDGTSGQNALSQAKLFHDAVGVTGIVLTKMDGTAKGGIIFAVFDALKIPIRFIGLGESPDDLQPFDPDLFVDAVLEP